MNRFLQLSCLSLLFLSIGNFAFSQEKKPDSRADTELSADDLAIAKRSFQDLVCARAADFECEFQDDAISIVLDRGFVDERFNAELYRVMKDSLHDENWQTEMISRSLKLLPNSTLEAKVQAKLAFECYLKSAVVIEQLKQKRKSTNSVFRLSKELSGFLALQPAELTDLLKEGVERDDLPPAGYTLVQYSAGTELLSLVVSKIGSKDSAVANAAMLAANTLMLRVPIRAPSGEDIARQGLDAKYVAYANRIVDRHDLNKDGRLSQSEMNKMLMKPGSTVDTNRDGYVSAVEYARLLQSKGKKK